MSLLKITTYITYRMIFAGLLSLSFNTFAGERIWVPVRWCGVEGAPSMVDPNVVNEASTDDVLWRRHERPTDQIYQDTVDMSFRAGATAAIKNGPQSFPIIRDPFGSGGDLINSSENSDAVTMCRRVWTMGDPLYFDDDNNGIINNGLDTLLSRDTPSVGFTDLGHDGAGLVSAPSDVRYVDSNMNSSFDIGEHVYRDENIDGVVNSNDTLLTGTFETIIGSIDNTELGMPLLAVPSQVKYLDLIRQPAATYNIGYPAVQGVTSVSANDIEFTGIAFPVHGVAASGLSGLGVTMDDPSQYLPPGPDFTLFETQLVAHEFGHSFGLNHGDGIDDDMNGILDDADDPTAPVPGAGPGTLCNSNNVMSYCWLDNGSSGNPDLEFIGPGVPAISELTDAQADVIRDFVLTEVSDRVVDPVLPPMIAARVDTLADVDEAFGHIDIADFSVQVPTSRMHTLFSLATRRPLPSRSTHTEYQFLLNIDANKTTGGTPLSIQDPSIKTDFTGVEYIATAEFQGREPIDVKFFRYVPQNNLFERVRLDKIQAEMVAVTMTPDFPMSRHIDPDGGQITPLADVPFSETITISVPLEVLAMPTDNNFQVEYIARDIDGNQTDHARSLGMNFDLPVFPDCHTEPGSIHQGESVDVLATGLLPNREVHLLLGDTQLGDGNTDANGDIKLSLPIPANAALGDRLVTVGALAVSADCNVIVLPKGSDVPGNNNDNQAQRLLKLIHACCRMLSIPLWIISIVLLIGLLLVIWRAYKT